MKKILLLSFILSAISCSSDIVPDSQKVCVLMEDQLDYLEKGFEMQGDRVGIINALGNYKTINDEIVAIKSKYDQAKFEEQLYSICADGEGEILELVDILEDELLYLDVQEVCKLQGKNYRNIMLYFDTDLYFSSGTETTSGYGYSKDGTIKFLDGPAILEMDEVIQMYQDYSSQINQIKSLHNEYLFEDRLRDFCDERYGGRFEPRFDYNELSKFYDVLRSKVQ